MSKEYLDSLDPLVIGDSLVWYDFKGSAPGEKMSYTSTSLDLLKKSMANVLAAGMEVTNVGANDFAMTGNRFTKTTKRLTPGGWVGKTVYGHINKRGRPVTHRVEHIRVRDQSHG